jgi:hypothetical protein
MLLSVMGLPGVAPGKSHEVGLCVSRYCGIKRTRNGTSQAPALYSTPNPPMPLPNEKGKL